MTQPQFTETLSKIPIKEYFELIEYFNKNLVVGVECERVLSMDTEIVARHLKTRNFTAMSRGDLFQYKKATTNEYNVAFVYRDGSVNGGNEIVFNGTAEKFAWIHDKLLKLENKLDKMNCHDYDDSCSNHITLVSLQDKLINPIVLKNLYNFAKAFSPAIYWLGSANSRVTPIRSRAGSYCPINYANPNNKTFNTLKSLLGRGMINLSKQESLSIADTEMLSGIRVEFRSPDGMRVPSALTSLMFLFRAIIYKAVELSTQGIIQAESMVDWREAKVLNSRLLSPNIIVDEDKDKLKALSKQLIDSLIPQLKMMSPEAIPILYDLAGKPISQRSGKWVKMEKEIMKKFERKLTTKEERLVEIVITKEFQGDNAGQWKKVVAEDMGVSTRMVEYMMKAIETKVSMTFIFDSEMKSYRIE